MWRCRAGSHEFVHDAQKLVGSEGNGQKPIIGSQAKDLPRVWRAAQQDKRNDGSLFANLASKIIASGTCIKFLINDQQANRRSLFANPESVRDIDGFDYIAVCVTQCG